MDSSRPANPTRKPIRSQQLDQTLQELECAFQDWDSLSSAKIRQEQVEEDRRKSLEVSAPDQEFAKKTIKLLNQLRDQLAELND
jgi:hypothetical protein